MSDDFLDIEHVPLPRKKGWVSKLKMLEPGSEESFTIPAADRAGMHALASNYKMKVVTRKEGDNVRVWRTK